MKRNKPPTIDAVLGHLADPSQPISVAKLYAFSNLDHDEVERVQAAWLTLPADRRSVAVRHLVDITETNFEVTFAPIFRLALTDPSAPVRAAALDGLWEEEDLALIPRFIKMLQTDPAPEVRAAAATALSQYVYLGEIEEAPMSKIMPALQALRTVIASDDALDVRRRAVEAIAFSSDDDVPGLIRTAYASPDELMRVSAVFAMGRSADEQWLDTVVSELEAQSPAIRYEAVRAAGELEARNAVPTLARLLDDPDVEVQLMVVWALGQIGGDRAKMILTELSEGDDAALAEAADDALEEMMWMHDAARDMPLFAFDPHADEEDE